MLIATLPTLTNPQTEILAEKIISHPLIDGVRYNTGGASPYSPKQILRILKPIADAYKKILYVDLEGRQVRVASWTPFSKGMVTLNRDFTIELPAKIHFRRAGWFEIVNALPEERKIFFKPYPTKREYYLGESQSVNVVAKKFQIFGYLNGTDFDYIAAAKELEMDTFMLSFVESLGDTSEFYYAYYACRAGKDSPSLRIVLKIESQKGMEFVERFSRIFLREFQLMAARDDLFLSFVEKRTEFLDALKLIIKKAPNAILASRLMLSLLDYQEELSLGDIADIKLMGKYGYKNFMLSDEFADIFETTVENWRNIALPLLEGKRWKKK